MSINTFELNQDIKKLSKQLDKFLKIYAYKSAFLHYEIEKLKHNDYLNILAVIFGYADYNQYNLAAEKNILTIDKLLLGINKFLLKLNPDSKYNQDDFDQIINTFKIYITTTEEEIIKHNKKMTGKITRLINKYNKNEKFYYEIGEIKRLYDIIKSKNITPIILDYKSIKLFEDEEFNEIYNLLKEYYDYKNALLIKKYIKDEKFDDRIGEHLYLLEDFIKDRYKHEYIPYETLCFLSDQFKYYHHGMIDCFSYQILSEFKKSITKKIVGNTALYKGIFNAVDYDGRINKNMNITRNKDGFWTSFDITLVNNDTMSFHIYEDGYVVANKTFNGEEIFINLFNYGQCNLQWTIPIAERKGYRSERYRFFYPKFPDDYFIFKLSFDDSISEIMINQQGFLEEKELKYTFKEIIGLLYLEYILFLYDKIKDNKDSNEIENIKKEIEKYDNFYKDNYKID